MKSKESLDVTIAIIKYVLQIVHSLKKTLQNFTKIYKMTVIIHFLSLQFSQILSVEIHYWKMDEEKFQFKCDFCEKSFFNEEILGMHIKSIHKSIIKGWKKCDLCENTFSNGHSLREHLKKTHFNTQIFECETCEKGFSTWKCIFTNVTFLKPFDN